MPLTTASAFKRFREDYVDLERVRVEKARVSRDFLVSQIKALQDTTHGIPPLDGSYYSFGSFARRTKIRPLDDIDILQPLKSGGSTSASWGSLQSEEYLWVPWDSPLRQFASEGGFVNSTRLLNRIRATLRGVSQYRSAEIKKSGEAVIVNLSSYEWAFDVVPGIRVGSGTHDQGFLIPNGGGGWQRTDPRIDNARVSSENQRLNSLLLPVVRILKYWNRRVHKPVLGSYYFEALVLKAFENVPSITSTSSAITRFFNQTQTYLWLPMPDPKGIGQALDQDVSGTTKLSVSQAVDSAHTAAKTAQIYEVAGMEKYSIAEWKKVFGPDFPEYG